MVNEKNYNVTELKNSPFSCQNFDWKTAKYLIESEDKKEQIYLCTDCYNDAIITK